MSAYAEVNDLPEGTAWVSHPCGSVWTVEEADDGFGKLCCDACRAEEPGRAYGGFVPVRPPSVEVTGGHAYAPVPLWLLRGDGPVLDAVEYRLVLAIWSHEFGKAYAWPSLDALVAETGSGRSTIKRALNRLVERGIVARWRSPGRRPSRYSVSRLISGEAGSASNRPAADPQPARSGPSNRPAADPEVETGKGETENGDPLARVARAASDSPSEPSGASRPSEPIPVGVEARVPAELLDAEEPDPESADLERVVAAETVPGGVLRDVPLLGDPGVTAPGGDAEAGGAGDRLAAHGGSSPGNVPADRSSGGGGYVGGPCRDPLLCRFRNRYPTGPWGCAENHPRVDGSPPDGRAR